MSIPLDRLYYHLDNLCDNNIIIYRWYPHGSKKLKDLSMFKEYLDLGMVKLHRSLTMICHDQEPLKFGHYDSEELSEFYRARLFGTKWESKQIYRDLIKSMPVFRAATYNAFTFYDKLILCHSEKNSKELELYENDGFIGVYYWSHAIIARDWFRYAEHDNQLKSTENFKYDFLIYNRAWSGTREYRLKFCEMLLEAGLIDNCKTSFAPFDSGVYYADHTFSNKDLDLTNFNLEDYFIENTTTSYYSADYNANDYVESGIEVVLETLFDDQRQHLTEKALRPIACNKPFILAATPNSLKYLRDYGFKTFDGLIDETYDAIIDSKQRLNAIVQELKRISCLSQTDKQELWKKLQVISEYNQNLFFSTQWHDMILNELQQNLKVAIDHANNHQTAKYLRALYSHPEMVNEELTGTKKALNEWLAQIGLTY